MATATDPLFHVSIRTASGQVRWLGNDGTMKQANPSGSFTIQDGFAGVMAFREAVGAEYFDHHVVSVDFSPT